MKVILEWILFLVQFHMEKHHNIDIPSENKPGPRAVCGDAVDLEKAATAIAAESMATLSAVSHASFTGCRFWLTGLFSVAVTSPCWEQLCRSGHWGATAFAAYVCVISGCRRELFHSPYGPNAQHFSTWYHTSHCAVPSSGKLQSSSGDSPTFRLNGLLAVEWLYHQYELPKQF